MHMNQRELKRNLGRIPRLLFHISRAKNKGQEDRAASMEDELKRRSHAMIAAGHEELLRKISTIKLDEQKNKDALRLQEIINSAKA